MSRTKEKKLESIAAELIALKNSGRSACLLLGAGCSVNSRIPLWETFAQRVLHDLGVENNLDSHESTAVARLQRYLVDNPMSRDLVTIIIDDVMSQARPSRGYRYLANLVSQKFYKTIVSTNWDWLLEDSLYRLMRTDEIVILTRDSAPDEYLANQIESAGNRIVVLKLHGDPKAHLRLGEGLTTRALSKELLAALAPRLTKVHVVGSSASDIDVLQLLFQRAQDSDILVVSRDTSAVQEPLRSLATAFVGNEIILSSLHYRPQKRGPVDPPPANKIINVGDFDHFFCQLTLKIESRLLRARSDRLAEIEASLLKKEESGVSYINYSQISRMTRAFLGQITRERTPDIVFFVNDPSAPGGMELKKRIESDLAKMKIAIGVLLIQGERNNRSFKRQFRGSDKAVVPAMSPDKVQSVHILDSITFSGNTLKIASEKVREWYPNAEVRLGALVISQLLVEQQADLPIDERIYYTSITDRFEIFFPWGVTQTTADFNRKFPGIDGDRLVHIARRPWGAIEILADEQPCSVRLLTIESGRRLSFQRHLCRDELFVALDDNIGLDICASHLEQNADPFDHAVKSMVLEKGDYILISRGIWHRTKASMDRVRLLEVGFGVYDQQYDIERLFDDFEREDEDGAK